MLKISVKSLDIQIPCEIFLGLLELSSPYLKCLLDKPLWISCFNNMAVWEVEKARLWVILSTFLDILVVIKSSKFLQHCSEAKCRAPAYSCVLRLVREVVQQCRHQISDLISVKIRSKVDWFIVLLWLVRQVICGSQFDEPEFQAKRDYGSNLLSDHAAEPLPPKRSVVDLYWLITNSKHNCGYFFINTR